MHITIAGSGNVGCALAGGWLKTGHRITFATRDVAGDKAGELREQGFGVVPLNDAATSTDVIVLAVPWAAVEATIRSLGDFAGKVLIDTTDPLKSGRELAIGFGDSGGETVARLVPSARVVKAFSTTGSRNMADSNYPGGKLMMALAGDDTPAKQIVMALVADLGFDPIDTGPLAMSRYLDLWQCCGSTSLTRSSSDRISGSRCCEDEEPIWSDEMATRAVISADRSRGNDQPGLIGRSPSGPYATIPTRNVASIAWR